MPEVIADLLERVPLRKEVCRASVAQRVWTVVREVDTQAPQALRHDAPQATP